MRSDIDGLMATARKLDPELWENVDRIARIIDPSAFAESWNGTGPDAQKRQPGVRERYMRSVAEHKAWMILQSLGIAPEEFDWIRLFRRARSPRARGERAVKHIGQPLTEPPRDPEE